MKLKNLTSLVIAILLISWIMQLSCNFGGNKVAVISLNGPIQSERGGLLFSGSVISPQLVRNELSRAKSDPAVKAIVLRIESPGGSVAACQEILSEIEQVKKPIVVSMGTVVASGGYYISAKADKIVALPGTLTGSIGVIAEVPNIKGLYQKLGIEIEVFKGGKHKDMYGGLRELTPEERGLMQVLTDQLYDQFVQVVAEGRHLSEEKTRELATGQLYTGVQAKELGLVDELGGISTAIDVAARLAGIEKPKVEYYKREAPSLLSFLLGVSRQKLQTLPQLQALDVESIVLFEVLTNPYPQPEYR